MHFLKRRPVVCLLLAALVLELTLCQASFWATVTQKGRDVTTQMEVIPHQVSMEEMETATVRKETAVYEDEQGYFHMPEGSLLIRLTGLNQEVKRLWLDVQIPPGYQIKAELFAQDEGNGYLYQLGKGRVLLPEVPQNAWMKLYPYGTVKNLYLQLETADEYGNAAAGTMGDLICRVDGLILNGRMPFVFRPVRLLLLFGVLCLFWGLRKNSSLHHTPFEEESPTLTGRRRRRLAKLGLVGLLLAGTFWLVQMNPDCRKNLALHHAQYQELAVALSQGEVSVGEADPRLTEQENPYDTISLQAGQIPYQADYAYYEGQYYVYFGIVPELLLYLPFYLITGRDLQNYQAVFLLAAGFVVAAAGLMQELMKRYFPRAPFYLWAVGTFLVTGSVAWIYLLQRPDLYHVPIAASCLFTTAGLWFYLAGLNRERKKALWYGAGSLCLALTAGCRPQFFLFAFPAVPLFWGEIFEKRALFSKKGWRHTLVLALPYLLVAAGLMYYNAIRFGSPFDFGAAYSLTSNDMTHRGFNLERIWYGLWYFLFQPLHLEADFPYLRSAAIETDYLGKMVSEGCFGGIFATSMLVWPVFALPAMGRRTRQKKEQSFVLACFALLAVCIALFICGADATGAGILQRYSLDISYGIYLAAAVGLLWLSCQAQKYRVYPFFTGCLLTGLLLHMGMLFLLLINADGRINLLTGNPVLYYTIQAALRI